MTLVIIDVSAVTNKHTGSQAYLWQGSKSENLLNDSVSFVCSKIHVSKNNVTHTQAQIHTVTGLQNSKQYGHSTVLAGFHEWWSLGALQEALVNCSTCSDVPAVSELSHTDFSGLRPGPQPVLLKVSLPLLLFLQKG